MKTGFINFRLGTLLILMAIIAVLIVALPPLYDWVNNPPSVPLSRVVAEFNELKATRNSQKDITEEEVLNAINSQLPTLVEAERVKKILRRIVDKRRVPTSTTISLFPVVSATSPEEKYWATNLNFPALESGYARYGIQIRVSPYAE